MRVQQPHDRRSKYVSNCVLPVCPSSYLALAVSLLESDNLCVRAYKETSECVVSHLYDLSVLCCM